MTIVEFINSNTTDINKRDKLILDEISNYINTNAAGFADGLYSNFLVIGKAVNKKFLDLYTIDMYEFKKFCKVNKTLSQDYQITKDLLKLCFLTSYMNTKEKVFLDFVVLMFMGSKFAHYFPYRTSDTYVNRMRAAVDTINGRSYIKKAGNMFGAIQLYTESMLNSPISNEYIQNMDKDDNMLNILGKFRNAANDMIKRLKNNFEKIKDDEKFIYFISDSVADDSIVEANSNYSFVSQCKYIISQYDASNYDYNIMSMLRITRDTPEEFYVFIKFITSEDKYFNTYANYYLAYYMSKYFTSIDDFKTNYIHKTITARLSNPEVDKLDNEVVSKLMAWGIEYQKNCLQQGIDVKLQTTNSLINAKSFLYTIKKYIILKSRNLINKYI